MPALHALRLASSWPAWCICAAVALVLPAPVAAQTGLQGAINGTNPATVVTVPVNPSLLTPGVPASIGSTNTTGDTVTTPNNPALAADGSANHTPGATLNVASPGLTVVTTNCCVALPSAVVAATAGGTIDLGSGTTVIGQGVIPLQNVGLAASAISSNNLGSALGQPSTITGENTTVTLTGGQKMIGAVVFGQAGQPTPTITLSDATIGITGAANTQLVYGIASLSGGTLSLTNSTLTINGPANTAAIYSQEPGTATFNVTNSTINSSGFGIIAVNGTTSNVNFSNATMTNAAGDFLESLQGSTVNLTAANGSQVSGLAFTAADSVSNMTLTNGSTWTMTDTSNLTNLTNAASTINFTPPVADPTQLASYKTLTVTNYAGANGTLGLNTFLGTDGSPSDQLVINGGTATGTTFLNIANTVGPGALTTGSGILVVDAINGATTDDAFRLAGPVIAGPFEYMLFKGNGNPEAWYLRSTVPTTGPPCPIPTPEGPAAPGGGGQPPVATVPEGPAPPAATVPEVPAGQAPNFRPEVSLDAALPNLSLLYGRSIVGTLHDRVGDETGADRDPAMGPHGAWGRVIAQTGDRDGGCPVLVGPSFDYRFAAVQTGFDVIRLQQASGARDRAGVYGVFGSAQADVQTQTGSDAGRDRFAAYTVGGYWTHYGAWGWYLDGLAHGTFYDAHDESTRIPALDTNGWGFAASLEAGIPFRGLLGGWGVLSGVTVEPQAQLVYQTINLGDTHDIAAQVRFEDVDSLAGRVGVRFATKWAAPGFWGLPPALTTAWFRPNYWHEFKNDARTAFSSAYGFLPFPANIAEDWVELNAGLTTQLDRTTALFATGSYDIATDGNGEAWEGRIGLKVAW